MLNKILIDEIYRLMKNPPPYKKWLSYCGYLQGEIFEECWTWKGGADKDGYGKTSYDKKHWRSHRLIMFWILGELPKGLVIDHSNCDNPPCCNPRHLTVTTSRLNTIRSIKAPSAINARKTHCPRGHELSGDNLYQSFLKRGLRACRKCTLEQNRESLKKRMKDPAYAEYRRKQKREAERKRKERLARKANISNILPSTYKL